MLLDKYIKARFIDSLGNATEVVTPNPETGKEVKIPFRVDKSYKRDPDKAEVTVYNLKESTRRRLGLDVVQIELYAGESENPPLIFKGEVTDAINERSEDFTTWVTRIYAEDTKSVLRTRVVARSYADGVPIKTVFEDLAAAGTLQTDIVVSGRTTAPFAVLAPVRDAIGEACKRFGCRQQIIDQRLVIRKGEEPIGDAEIPLLSPETGLRGVPTADLEKKKVVKVSATSKMNSKLVPGGKCIIKTAATTGSRKAPLRSGAVFFIERVVHNNDEGSPMSTDITTREFK